MWPILRSLSHDISGTNSQKLHSSLSIELLDSPSALNQLNEPRIHITTTHVVWDPWCFPNPKTERKICFHPRPHHEDPSLTDCVLRISLHSSIGLKLKISLYSHPFLYQACLDLNCLAPSKTEKKIPQYTRP